MDVKQNITETDRINFKHRLFGYIDDFDCQEQEVLQKPPMPFDAKMRLCKVLALMLENTTLPLLPQLKASERN